MQDIFTHLDNFHMCILQWYKINGRKLPWREANHCKTYAHWHKQNTMYNTSFFSESSHLNIFTPMRAYRVWISEIMLQQTQVQRVLTHYYFQFLEKFPNLHTLACANIEDILKIWQGLGYYTRAKNLHKSAKYCKENFNSELPNDFTSLKKLSGIGDYTAGAIACFGYGQNVGFADSNISRLLSRLFAKQNITSKEMTQLAQKILNLNASFEHNQALIDLGSMICTPKNAQCTICPLHSFCLGKAKYEIYGKTKKIAYEKKNLILLLLVEKEKIAFLQHQGKRFQNLYSLPEFTGTTDELHSFGSLKIGSFSHSFTKYRLKIDVFYLETQNIKSHQKNTCIQNLNAPLDTYKITEEQLIFIPKDSIKHLAYANLTQKALNLFTAYSNNLFF